ncbi:MAG: 50S ribosomal protein L11 methyltransferase [Oscillospiraceae bacterium]|nr:50S ribosomal protein L11 methyltransferase [Oscillospiraceae bacterium]
MQWLELTIQTRSEGLDALTARLTALGYDSFIIDDEQDFLQFLEQNRAYWDYVDESLAASMRGVSRVRLYLEDQPGSREEIASLRAELDRLRGEKGGESLGTLEVTVRTVADEDWANSWKQYYQPLAVGKKLLIIPQWLEAENPEGRVTILLDPGLIFGTGAHASTQMCLRALEERIRGGEQVLDLGSGSGILSIAALRLGAKSAVGVDIDPIAEDIARENAALNSLGPDRFTARTGDVLSDTELLNSLGNNNDVVLANIVADVIIPLSAAVPKLLGQDGLFLCSGILNTRLDEVRAALRKNGLTVTHAWQQNDWCCLAARPSW